jgi:hypothetical protein
MASYKARGGDAMSAGRFPVAWLVLGAILLVLNLVLLVRGTHFSAYAQEQKRFQYKIVDVLPDTQVMQSTLNQYGNDGWELVAVSMGELTAPRFVFKR